MNCPVCTTVQLAMSDRQGVEIDYCPSCRGVWLDRGELDKLIERSARFDDDRDREHHRGDDDYPHHGHYRKKKRRSFLEDVFDFG